MIHPTQFLKRSSFALSLPAIFLLILATLAALLGTDLYRSYDREFDIHRQNAANLGDVIERHVRASIDKIDVVLLETVHAHAQHVAKLNPKRPIKMAELEAINRDLLRREAYIPEAQTKSLRIVDAQGQVIFSANDSAELPRVNVGDRAYFLRQKEDPAAGLVMSEPILSRFTGKWLFTLSRRMVDADGNFMGLVQTAMRADQFELGFTDMNVGQKGNISLFSLVSKDIRLMARKPSIPDKLGKTFDIPEIAKAHLDDTQKGTYRAVSRVDGIDRVFVFRQFEGLPLVVNIGVDYDSLLENWWNKALLYGFSVLLLILELIWLITNQRRQSAQQHSLLEEKVQERTVALSEANAQLEMAMREAQSANFAKTQFLATVSHELRTPLNGILGMAELLEMTDCTQEEQKEYAHIIVSSGSTLLSVVNGILDFARLESGKTELQLSFANPSEIVLETTLLFQQLAQQKNLELVSEIDPTAEGRFQLDTIRLKQMLGNLVSNAIKFTDHGSVHICLSATSDESDQKHLTFSVLDTGTGIPEDKLALLFQPFSQVDSSYTRAHGGTGLGLSIVRKLAELMGGTAGVESSQGTGSRFWFKIPAEPQPV